VPAFAAVATAGVLVPPAPAPAFAPAPAPAPDALTVAVTGAEAVVEAVVLLGPDRVLPVTTFDAAGVADEEVRMVVGVLALAVLVLGVALLAVVVAVPGRFVAALAVLACMSCVATAMLFSSLMPRFCCCPFLNKMPMKVGTANDRCRGQGWDG